MSKENLSVNLRRYMKIKGLSIPQFEEISSVSHATISNILNAKADPSFSTLEKISSALGIKIQDLFSEKPVLKSLRYRTNKTMSAREKAAKENLLYTVAQKLETYSDLENYSGKKLKADFNSFPEDPKEAAFYLRSGILNILPEMPIKNFSSKLTELGIKQFYFNFGLSKTFGLSVNEIDGGPAIFINTGTANVERWIFSTAHELGHLILQPESYNGQEEEYDKNSYEEKAADDFAAEFLLPIDTVKKLVHGTKGFSFIRKIMEIKKEYSVSYTTALKQYSRAYNREYSDVITKFKAMYKNWKGFEFKEFAEPEPLEKSKYIFEDSHLYECVLSAMDSKKINISQAAQILNENEEFLKEEFNSWKIFSDIPF